MNTTKESPKPPRLDAQRHAVSSQLLAVFAAVLDLARRAEVISGLRDRLRSDEAHDLFAAAIHCIVANAAYLSTFNVNTFRCTRDMTELTRIWRYRPPVFSRQLVQAVDAMRAAGLVTLVIGSKAYFPPTDSDPTCRPIKGTGRQTEVTATAALLSLLAGTGDADTARWPDNEVVMLKAPKADEDEDKAPQLLNYDDTELTNKYRTEVRAINAHLMTFDVEYTGRGHLDTNARYLYRGFTNNDWLSGGRLSATDGGAFWYPLKQSVRLEHISIDHEPVASLDFKGMGISLAYHTVLRAELPSVDPYDFPVALERDLVKQLVSAMMFAKRPLGNWPRRMQGLVGGVKVADATAAVLKAHPKLRDVFYTGRGHVLQHVESSILVDAMLKLAALGIPALPMHDAVYTPAPHIAVVARLMHEAYAARCGGCAPKIEVSQYGFTSRIVTPANCDLPLIEAPKVDRHAVLAAAANF